MISTFPSKLPESKNAQEQSKVLPEWETKPEEKTGRWGRCVHFIVCSDREDREIGGCGVDGVCGMCVCVCLWVRVQREECQVALWAQWICHHKKIPIGSAPQGVWQLDRQTERQTADQLIKYFLLVRVCLTVSIGIKLSLRLSLSHTHTFVVFECAALWFFSTWILPLFIHSPVKVSVGCSVMEAVWVYVLAWLVDRAPPLCHFSILL